MAEPGFVEHVDAPTGDLQARVLAALTELDRAVDRLEQHANRYGTESPTDVTANLTAPDKPSGERWDAGQVWAHIAEFGSYWLPQLELILDLANEQPVPFGRVKTNEYRIAEIERNRACDVPHHMSTIRNDIARYRDRLSAMTTTEWGRTGVHSTLGVMDMWTFLDHFVTGHYHEHADQLDGIAPST